MFGLVQGPAPDQFLVGLATLTLLAEAARDTPLLCVVDDAQWLDTASTGVLAFVARRLLADRIGMFFCVRDQPSADQVFGGLPELHLDGLDEAGSLALVARHAASAGPHVARRIVTAACGNPLAIGQFAERLTPMELRGDRPTAELPVSSRVEAIYASRIGALSVPARTVLLLASVEQSGDAGVLWRAAAVLGVAGGERGAVEDEVGDFLTFGPEVVFRHPLVRSAVYGASSSRLRRAAHGALAQVIDGRTDPDRHSWHLAAATNGPDEAVAVHLERSAGRARARGGYAAESAFLARAAELTPEPDRAGARLLAAAEAAANGGDYHRCQALLTQAEPLLTGPAAQARAALLRAISLAPLGRTDAAPAALMASAQALGRFDPALARQTWSGALSAGWQAMTTAKGTTLHDLAQAALAAAPALDDGAGTAEDLLRVGIATRVAGDYAAAAPMLRKAIAGLSSAAEAGATLTFQPMLVLVAAHDVWDPHGGSALLRKAAEQARERGALPALWQCLECLSYTERWAGRLEAGRAYEGEAEVIREAIGLGSGWRLPVVEMLALRGDDAGSGAWPRRHAAHRQRGRPHWRVLPDARSHVRRPRPVPWPLRGGVPFRPPCLRPGFAAARQPGAARTGGGGDPGGQRGGRRGGVAPPPGARQGQRHRLGTGPAVAFRGAARAAGRGRGALPGRHRPPAARTGAAGPRAGTLALRRMAAQGTPVHRLGRAVGLGAPHVHRTGHRGFRGTGAGRDVGGRRPRAAGRWRRTVC